MPFFSAARLASTTLFALSLVAGAASAQSTGDAANGKLLFEDTPNASGISTLTATCAGCHNNSVQDRRAHIVGSSEQSPVISFETALNKFGSAVGRVGGMRQFEALSAAQFRDIAAYIADTPTVSATSLTFTTTARNTSSTSQTLTVTSPKAPNATVTVKSIAMTGAGAANFVRTFQCDSKAFTPAGSSCPFSVTYTPKDTATSSTAVMTITLNEGASPDIVRQVALNGSIVGTTPTPTPTPTPAPTPAPAAPADDSGGGAMGWAWLLAVAAATAALAARRRN